MSESKDNPTTASPEFEAADRTYRDRLFFGVLACVIAVLFLEWLRTAPDRPPQDASTLLGGPELAAVGWLMLALTILGSVLLILLVVSIARSFSSQKPPQKSEKGEPIDPARDD